LPFLPSERTWGDFLIYAPLAHDVNPELLRYSFISREKVNDYFPLLAFFFNQLAETKFFLSFFNREGWRTDPGKSVDQSR